MTTAAARDKSALRALIAEGHHDDARSALYAWARDTTDYRELSFLSRMLGELPDATDPDPEAATRVALLSGATDDLIRAPLVLALASIGLTCTWHYSAYDTYAYELLDPSSETASFAPHLVILLLTPSNLPHRPRAHASVEEVDALVDRCVEHWLGLCQSIHERTRCDVILNTLHAAGPPQLGNLDAKIPWTINTFIRRINARLAEAALPFVHLVDVAGLAAEIGLRRWVDERMWYHAKQPMSLDAIGQYVRNVAHVAGAIYGRSAKCLVLDLDNTMWGGVVGDDGVEGIVLGQGNAVGEAFQAFQAYVRSLRERGIMLAVCSKNDEANALAPFERHPEMILRRDDIVAFVANWEPKPSNIRRIATELNIGLDAMVFVDDNPAEREHVRQELPSVRVLELSDDPAEYPRLLAASGWLETVSVSAEDARRTETYRQNQARAEVESAAGDYGEYLRSLDQRAVIRPFEEPHLDRITQLTNKSNQFNLTTRRVNRSTIENEARDPNRITRYVRLADRFGDNGLICVFSARIAGRILEIDQWLMSCRVLKRSVEHLLLNVVAEEARRRGCEVIHGRFIPSGRNELVREHYGILGFSVTAGRPEDETVVWSLDLRAFEPLETFIDLVEEY